MNSIDLLLIGIRNLWRRKLRTFLTVLGVIIGTASIIIMLSFGLAISKQNEQMLSQFGDAATITIHQNSDMIGFQIHVGANFGNNPESSRKDRDIILNDNTVNKLRKFPHIESLAPIKETMVNLKKGRKINFVNLVGMDTDQLKAFGLIPKEDGRLPNPGESMVAIAGPYVSDSFYDPNSSGSWNDDGEDLYTGNIELLATDYFEESDNSPFVEDKEGQKPNPPKFKLNFVGELEDMNFDYFNTIILPTNDVNNIIKEKKNYEKRIQDLGFDSQNYEDNSKDEYDRILVKVDNIQNVEFVQELLEDEGYTVSSMLDMSKALAEQTKIIQMILGGIGAISLVVAAIGITNTMVMSIYERTREIGVMKVIGAGISDIRNMFLLEAGLIGLLGGTLGVMISLLASHGLNTLAQGAMEGFGGDMEIYVSVIPPWLVLLAIIFSIGIGILSGYYPAHRATRLSALEAMRNE